MSTARPTGHSSADEFALLVDLVQDYAIFLLSTEGEIRSWNQGAARLFGYTTDQVVGKHFSMFYTDADVAARKPQRKLEVAAEQGRIEDEGWRIRADGTRFWVNTVLTALRDDTGTLVGFAKVTRDLTERREAEEKLRHNEELFRLLVTSVKDYAIFMLDVNGNVATWNAGAHNIKGYTADEIIGRHFSVFYPPEDLAAGKPARELEIAQAEGSVEDEGWRVRKDGTRFWANVVITAVRDSSGQLRGFAKVTRDITQRKQTEEMRQSLLEQREARLQAEEERRRAEASYTAAQEANKAKDEFLMTLSHELRTPMTAILGWSRLLPTMRPGDAMFEEAVAAIGRSAEHQAKLIDDVLDVSRIVSGKLRLTLEPLEVEKLLRSAVDAVRPMAQARSVILDLSLAPGLGTFVVDPTRLQQVIWNLLTNAVKFTPKGGMVTVSARRTSSHVQIAVRDNGSGIDPRFLPHVFEPFRQAESPRTRVHGGLGLGLSIVRYLVEAHGGTVSAESTGKGQGATFTVTLPIAAIRPTREEQPENRGALFAAPAKRLGGLQTLVVDDDRGTRDYIQAVLRQAGANVIAVDSAEAALTEIAGKTPELILSDIAMPGMDGFEFARVVRGRKLGGGLKIVALSAFPAGTTAEHDSFDLYLTKPIDPVELVDAIARTAGR